MTRAKLTGVKAVRWHTSPACARLLDRLACKGPGSPDVLAAELHIQEKYAFRLLRDVLRQAERVHVVGYRHNVCGPLLPIYSIGPGKDAKPPKPETPAQRAKRRRAALKARYGTEITERMLNPGRYDYPRIYVDGRRVSLADHNTQLAKRN